MHPGSQSGGREYLGTGSGHLCTTRNTHGPMATPPAILWFRHDLRLDDNPALHAALTQARPVIPVFIWDPESEGDWRIGSASRCWLHGSLGKLDQSLRAVGSRLILRQGESLQVLRQLVDETRANAVFWNRRYEPAVAARDGRIEATLRRDCVSVSTFNASLLFEPEAVRTHSSTPYRVFTPFYRACLALPEPAAPIPAPTSIQRPRAWPTSCELGELRLLPKIPWDVGIRADWTVGEAAALSQLAAFQATSLGAYPTERDRPDRSGTSRLSPYLHFGEVSPRRVWHTVREITRGQTSPPVREAADGYLRQLVWREFAHHLLHHYPHTTTAPLNTAFTRFPWQDNPDALRAWEQGRTGYPVIDAGMRQLWATGWMHNRVRMLVGSFLVKDLLIGWQHGARWFWDTLVDADLANNTLGWQWVAGCGADAAPYFRVFNPVTQGERFDPQGHYVRRWVPELARLPDRWVHQPWLAPEAERRTAGVELGRTYPWPIIDHDAARKTALEAYKTLRGK